MAIHCSDNVGCPGVLVVGYPGARFMVNRPAWDLAGHKTIAVRMSCPSPRTFNQHLLQKHQGGQYSDDFTTCTGAVASQNRDKSSPQNLHCGC